MSKIMMALVVLAAGVLSCQRADRRSYRVARTPRQELRHERPPPLVAPANVAAPPPEATRTASQLVAGSALWSKVLRSGTGTRRPEPQDIVVVHYSGWTSEGALFDSTTKLGVPGRFALSEVIPGWTEGIGLMVEGERRRFW